ncbi:MAG: hypothetical protein A2074_04110 [Candidatus Aquicultor primus]|uniref:Acyltransferase n=1 Tax=Candidatus Aquicultor primus TaxID=1797195 RepID=A0A1F2URR8_9ACTN|nr:MAG: hypothetical protein A2074_04110 [Candidatus Aquicultor primus]
MSRVAGKLRNFWLSAGLNSGRGLSIGPGAYLRGLAHIRAGKNFVSGVNLRLEAVTQHCDRRYSPEIIIGDNVAVSDYVHIGAVTRVEIGNNVLMGSKVYISDHSHGDYSGPAVSSPDVPPNLRALTTGKTVVIEDNVWIGDAVAVLPGVRIGYGSVIGANSVVSRDIPPLSIAVGAPARAIKKWDPAAKVWAAIGDKQ